MASFSSLPLELVLLISRLLEFSDLKTLASLNSRLRDIVAPRVFQTIRFTNREADEEIVSQVISKRGQHAIKCRFDFHLEQDSHLIDAEPLPDGRFYGSDDDDEEVLIGTKLTGVASRILSGEEMSQVSFLSVNFLPQDEFCGGDWGDSQGLGSIYIYELPTHPASLEQDEEQWPSWRRTMAHMWSSLCRNHNIASLEIIDLPALPLSSWLQPEWPAFLGRLGTLLLGLGGGDNGAGWRANTSDGYRDFLEHLDAHFFDHLESVSKLHLTADSGSYYGDSEMWPSVTALRPGHFPNVEELRLENFFLDDKCCAFLEAAATGEKSRLKKLYLIECMSNSATPSWADIFSRLHTRPSLSLEDLVVTNEKVEFPRDYESNVAHLPVTDRQRTYTIAVRSSPVQEGESSRPFAYGTVDDKYGMIFSDEERNVEEFESGLDMEAYRKLMKLLANKKSLTTSD